jgi:SpoIID/LytB domain protein
MKTRYLIFSILVILIVSIISNYLFINNRQILSIYARENKEILNYNNIGEMLLRARDNYYNGNADRAIEIYNQVLSIKPDHLEALKNLSFITREIGKYNSAVKYNNKIIKLNPDNLYWKLRQGILLYQIGDCKKAKTLLLDIFNKLSPQLKTADNSRVEESKLSINDETLLYYYLGKLNLVNNDLHQASHFFQLGINTLPQITLNYLGQAEVFKKEGALNKAILAYKSALTRDSSLSFIYPELATLYEELGEASEAYYYWNRSLETNNQNKLASSKLEVLKKEHPEFVETELERKADSRKKIEWVNVEPLPEAEEIPLVRVGLTKNVNSISLQTGSSFLIKNKNDNTIYFEGQEKTEYNLRLKNRVFYIYQNEKLLREIESTTPLLLELTDNRSTFVIYDINYGSGYFWAGTEDRQYRGVMELYPLNNDLFNVINIINLEEYLFSVVPAEMPAWWPIEALKAQVIAARSYALSHLGRHSREGYDLCATVHCAVYNGVQRENKRTNQAVLETRGEVATYNNRIIDAVFSSNSGGYSESSLDVWGHKLEYLQGTSSMLEDSFNFPLEPYKLEEWLLNEPPSFSVNRKYAGINTYRWTRLLNSDYLKEKYNLTHISEIKPVGRSKGGSINQILIKGDGKEIAISKDRIRSALGGLKSNRFILYQFYNSDGNIDKIIFYGAGWGHNVGMDQTGAAGMAELGYTYNQIIQHYYQGVEIIDKY